MRFLKAITTEGEIETFNLERILTIKPHGDKCKILMGAGLYWWVHSDSMEIIGTATDLLASIREENV